jgi:hypothetical protein
MPQLGTIVPLTELQAVNYMLRQIGEAPIAQGELDTITREDVDIAVDILRQTIAHVQSHGWKFNTEFEYRIAVSSTKFDVPSNLLSFEVSPRTDQRGVVQEKQDDGTFSTNPTKLDIVIRDDGGTLRFYERNRNTFAFGDATVRPQIFIRAVFSEDFSGCPETFRHYVTVVSAREFVKVTLQGDSKIGPTNFDERKALKILNKDQGHPVEYDTVFDHWDVARVRGNRPSTGVIPSSPVGEA